MKEGVCRDTHVLYLVKAKVTSLDAAGQEGSSLVAFSRPAVLHRVGGSDKRMALT